MSYVLVYDSSGKVTRAREGIDVYQGSEPNENYVERVTSMVDEIELGCKIPMGHNLNV